MALITNFTEERFPDGISYGSTGGPMFSTNIVSVNSGFEQRNINWSEARAVYNVAHAVKTEAQMAELIHFFRMVRGRAIGFRFKDWTDYSTTGESIAIADGILDTFQLIKTYTYGLGILQYVRTINKPVDGTVTIYVDGIADGTATVDTTTGIVTFVSPPALGAVITADFEFDVPVRFDSDEMPITLDTSVISTWGSISLVEVKPR